MAFPLDLFFSFISMWQLNIYKVKFLGFIFGVICSIENFLVWFSFYILKFVVVEYNVREWLFQTLVNWWFSLYGSIYTNAYWWTKSMNESRLRRYNCVCHLWFLVIWVWSFLISFAFFLVSFLYRKTSQKSLFFSSLKRRSKWKMMLMLSMWLWSCSFFFFLKIVLSIRSNH